MDGGVVNLRLKGASGEDEVTDEGTDERGLQEASGGDDVTDERGLQEEIQ